MLVRWRGFQLAAGVAALALAAAGCGASSKSGSGGTATQNLNNSGTPKTGGTLHMLGTGDVDYMDPNSSYYAIGYLGLRMWSRQLVTYPAVQGKVDTDVPDLVTQLPTTSNGGISKDGLTYKFTIQNGIDWNTSPARQVTAADEVRGVKRTCNPAQPFGGLPDFESLIQGFQAFCDGFAKVDPKDAAAMAAYVENTPLSGVAVDPSNPQTVVFTLNQPASYFLAMVALPAFSPAPKEYDAYIPAGAQLAQHTISDGPYQVKSYNPGHELDFVRNPDWKASTDNVRKAYVDAIDINETGNADTIQQQLEANTANADMEFDAFPPVSAVPGLIQKKDPNFYLGPTFSSNPYVVFNTVSPNNNKALQNVAVRKALEEAINRDNLIQDDDGPAVSPPLTHVLPAGISGTVSDTSINLYTYSATQAKKDLAAAGYPNGLTLKFLYRPASTVSAKMYTTLQQDLALAGIKLTGVGVPNADFYTKYLEVPTVAQKGTWDVSLAGWGPDWYGDAALSFFGPLFDGKAAFPPIGSNFGFYDDPKVDTLVTTASKEQSSSKAAADWTTADKQVMDDAAFFPITANNLPNYHSSHVHNAVFMPVLEQDDPTNVWLSTS